MSEACRDCFIRSDRRWPAGVIGILPWYGVDRHSKFSEQEACELCLRPLACGDVVEGTTKLFLYWTLWSRFMMIFDHFCFRDGRVLRDASRGTPPSGFRLQPVASPKDCACHAHLPSAAGQQNALRTAATTIQEKRGKQCRTRSCKSASDYKRLACRR